jgi:branched-chain amino acid transport system ATP-binding protein
VGVEGNGLKAPIVSATKIAVRFGGVRALDDVSLNVHPSEVVGLIGPNGAGKTTLFDVVSGLTPPSDGTLAFAGVDVTNKSAVWRARWGLRRTFQRQQIFGRLSVEENLLAAVEWESGGGGMVADLVHLPSRTRRERARRAKIEPILEMCSLTPLRTSPACSLPIGAARLLEVGRALAGEPKVLLLDEPTSGLGAAETETLANALGQVRLSSDCAVLLVEHNINFVMAQADVVYVLATGSVLAYGTPAQIRAHDDVKAAYLG